MERHLSCRPFRALFPFALGMSLAACGASVADGDNELAEANTSEPSVSAQSYKSGASAHPGVVDVETAQQALTALTRNVDVSVRAFKTNVELAAGSGNGGGAAQSVDAPCVGGGAADVDGYMNMAPSPVAIDIRVAIAFSGCATPSGTMVDGHVEFSQSLATPPDATGFQVETIYEGDINLSGNVNVSCPVDLNVLVDETGRALTLQGTFCNQDASELAMQLQPLWKTL